MIWPIQQKTISRRLLLLEIKSSAKTLPMTTSMLTSSEMAAAAISMSSASSSKAHQSSLHSGRWTGSTCKKSWPDWNWAVTRATAVPQRTPCQATSRTRWGMSRGRAATVSPRAFTDPVAVAAAAWRVSICDSRTDKMKS